MAEVLQPQAGMSICDWASGSGGLLLQSIRYVKAHGGDVRQIQLHGQESNVATYNISRINMILHGIPVWEHKQGGQPARPAAISQPTNRLKVFDRIIMNPPFSLEGLGLRHCGGGGQVRAFVLRHAPHEQWRLGLDAADCKVAQGRRCGDRYRRAGDGRNVSGGAISGPARAD